MSIDIRDLPIKPLYDRVVLKVEEPEKVSAGGIVLPSQAQETPDQAVVVAVGFVQLMRKSSDQKLQI